MKTKQFTAWAINTNEEPYGLIGRYWHFGEAEKLPIHLEGCKTALFTTRKIARQNLKHVKGLSFPKAKVVKVTVTLEWEQ